MNKRLRKKKGLSKITNKELWNLDINLAKYILPRLKRFKESVHSYPPNITFDEYIRIIDKMIWSFEFIIEDGTRYIPYEEDNFIKCQEGLDLFAKYFRDLWD